MEQIDIRPNIFPLNQKDIPFLSHSNVLVTLSFGVDYLLPENRIATHPGEILKEEFLAPVEITQVALAQHIGVPLQRVNEIIRGKRGITPETAWLLSQALGTTPQFWMNLQDAYDLTRKRPKETIERLIKAA